MFEVYNTNSILCIVLEYVAGQTLFDLVNGSCAWPAAASTKIPEDKSRPIAAQLIAALAHMHSKRIVHRDNTCQPPY